MADIIITYIDEPAGIELVADGTGTGTISDITQQIMVIFGEESDVIVLKGDKGDTGIPLSGTTDPTDDLGVNGLFYINTITRNVFGPKANGIWPAGGLLADAEAGQIVANNLIQTQTIMVEHIAFA